MVVRDGDNGENGREFRTLHWHGECSEGDMQRELFTPPLLAIYDHDGTCLFSGVSLLALPLALHHQDLPEPRMASAAPFDVDRERCQQLLRTVRAADPGAITPITE